jgi:hypothetical protein
LHEFGRERLRDLGEREKTCWLFAAYAVNTVAGVCTAIRSVKQGTTAFQRSQILAQHSKLPAAEATALGDFIEHECSSLLEIFAPQPEDNPLLTPPVNTCLECNERLVANHTCQVKYYSSSGVSVATKITLRCTNCSLFYNYSNYGDKRVRGFRHYPSERAAVEASDTVYFDRVLFEFQCSLA